SSVSSASRIGSPCAAARADAMAFASAASFGSAALILGTHIAANPKPSKTIANLFRRLIASPPALRPSFLLFRGVAIAAAVHARGRVSALPSQRTASLAQQQTQAHFRSPLRTHR